MDNNVSLIQYAENNKTAIKCLLDRVATWVFGYIYLEQKATRQDLYECLKTSESESIDASIDKLIEAGYIREEQGILIPTDTASRFAKMLNLSRQTISANPRPEISIDLYLIDNLSVSNATKTSKKSLISELIDNPRLHSVPGYRYGFVDCKRLGENVLFGYLTQEYTAHFIDYDDNIIRHDEWSTKFHNTLFVWPLESQVYILQDTRFPGAPTLNMFNKVTHTNAVTIISRPLWL